MTPEPLFDETGDVVGRVWLLRVTEGAPVFGWAINKAGAYRTHRKSGDANGREVAVKQAVAAARGMGIGDVKLRSPTR